MQHKQPHNRMHRQHRPLRNNPPRHLLLHPPLPRPIPHQRCDAQARRDRQAHEVGCFAARVFGYTLRGHVEAGEAGEPGEHEAGEEELVEGRADADGEGARGGGDAEGDL